MPSLQTAFDFGMPVGRSTNATVALIAARAEQEAFGKLPARLARSFGQRVIVSLTDNTRTMISARSRAGLTHVRLHHMFVNADASTIDAIGRYLAAGDRAAQRIIQRFVAASRELIRRRVPRAPLLKKDGHHHDLGAIFTAVNAAFFQNSIEARIGWGRRGVARGRHRKRRRSIKLGSYLSQKGNGGAVIRVHPVLDAAWVPRFFVEYIVYHEMLHHVVKMPVLHGRRTLHGPEFKAREKLFPRFAEALAWEREHLDRLLSS
jgi:hypothetical protein